MLHFVSWTLEEHVSWVSMDLDLTNSETNNVPHCGCFAFSDVWDWPRVLQALTVVKKCSSKIECSHEKNPTPQLVLEFFDFRQCQSWNQIWQELILMKLTNQHWKEVLIEVIELRQHNRGIIVEHYWKKHYYSSALLFWVLWPWSELPCNADFVISTRISVGANELNLL